MTDVLVRAEDAMAAGDARVCGKATGLPRLGRWQVPRCGIGGCCQLRPSRIVSGGPSCPN